MVTPLGWLENASPPTKSNSIKYTKQNLHTYGLLGYQTLQTADI